MPSAPMDDGPPMGDGPSEDHELSARGTRPSDGRPRVQSRLSGVESVGITAATVLVALVLLLLGLRMMWLAASH